MWALGFFQRNVGANNATVKEGKVMPEGWSEKRVDLKKRIESNHSGAAREVAETPIFKTTMLDLDG